MKGHKDSDGRFHPHIKHIKSPRKSRDKKTKTQGIRFQIGHQDLMKNKSYWEVTLENPRKESGTTTHVIELEGMATEQDVKNALLRMYDYDNRTYMYYPQDLERPYLHSIKRLKRDNRFYLPPETKNAIKKDLGSEYFEVIDQNPKWKLTHIIVNGGSEFFVFPDEESALKFGIQSIRDTATEYIPDKDTPEYEEWKNLSNEELVDKILEEQSDYGQRSELGAVAQSVASYDGQYTELNDGSIAFQIS